MCHGASGASPTRALEPVRGPSLSDLLPPLPQETLPSPQHVDSLPPPAPEPSAHDPLPPPVPESSSRDPPHLPSPVLDLEAPLSSLSTTTMTTMRRTCPRPRLYLPSACSRRRGADAVVVQSGHAPRSSVTPEVPCRENIAGAVQ